MPGAYRVMASTTPRTPTHLPHESLVSLQAASIIHSAGERAGVKLQVEGLWLNQPR